MTTSSPITDHYPYAECGQCGWIGRITELQDGKGAFLNKDECCPECGCDDTEWLTSDEYVALMKEYGDE